MNRVAEELDRQEAGGAAVILQSIASEKDF